MARVRIRDVARLAGVSEATVDRVLHARDGVSARAARKVVSAVNELGYGKLPGHLLRVGQRSFRFALLLPLTRTAFAEDLERIALERAEKLKAFRIFLTVQTTVLDDEKDLQASLRELEAGQFDALALFAFDVPGVRHAIDRLIDHGTHVVTLVSDAPSSKRFAFVGQDNVVAGRTAGRLVSFFAPPEGHVAVVLGSQNFRDHAERLLGFRQVIEQAKPGLRLLSPFEGRSLASRNQAYLSDLFERDRDVVALYCAGGGIGGVIEAIRAAGRPIAAVAHELTEATRDAMIDGTLDALVHQDRDQLIDRAIEAMRAAVSGDRYHAAPIESRVVLLENLA